MSRLHIGIQSNQKEKGLIKIPKTSIGIKIMYNGILAYHFMEDPKDQKCVANNLWFL